MINPIFPQNLNKIHFKGALNKYFKKPPLLNVDTFEYQNKPEEKSRLKGDLVEKIAQKNNLEYLLNHGIDKKIVSEIKNHDISCANKAQILFENGLAPRDLVEFSQFDDERFEKLLKLLPFTRHKGTMIHLLSYSDEGFDKLIRYLSTNMSSNLAQLAVNDEEQATLFKFDSLIESGINGSDAFRISHHADCAERFLKFVKKGLDKRTSSILANTEKMQDFKEKDVVNLVKFLRKFEKDGREDISQDVSEFLLSLSYRENKDEFFNFLNKIDVDLLVANNPKMAQYSPREMLLFLKYHFYNETDISNEKIEYKDDLKGHLEKNFLNAKKLCDLLAAYPDIDRKIGEIPSDWKNSAIIDDEEQFKEEIYDLIEEFNKNRDMSDFQKKLAILLNKEVNLTHIADGYWGSGFRLEIEGAKDTCLKLFHKTTKKDDELYDLECHGQKIEPQTAIFLNKNANNFVKMFFTKLCGIGDTDGFLVTQYLDKYTVAIQECKEPKKGLLVRPRDNYKNKNAINDVIFDFGDISISDFNKKQK